MILLIIIGMPQYFSRVIVDQIDPVTVQKNKNWYLNINQLTALTASANNRYSANF